MIKAEIQNESKKDGIMLGPALEFLQKKSLLSELLGECFD
jgi:hypothetical protein